MTPLERLWHAVYGQGELWPLTDRETLVLDLRVVNGLTLEQTGEVVGATRERVRQIESCALATWRRRARELHWTPRLGQVAYGPFDVPEGSADS